MLFSNRPRTHYEANPIHEVICQLRFPTILSINQTEPADFQEQIRDIFPQYACKQETLPPQIVNGKPVAQPPVNNYNFISMDNRWKINLTKDFIAVSTLSYSDWEEFAHMLDRPLASFIQLYKPAYFQRVGLRYMNLISRAKLNLEGTPWAELIAPAYLGVLTEEDFSESNLLHYGYDVQLKLDSSSIAKIHAGPGKIQVKNSTAPQDPEVKFIFDMDLSMSGNTPCGLAAASLEMLHGHANRIFEGAITDTLREAMGQQ